MPVLKFKETPYEEVKEGVDRKILYTENLMTVIIDFSNGPWAEAEPPHKHPHEQTAYVASGEILFKLEGETDQKLGTGDMYAVPPNKLHTIQLLSESARIVDNFTPVRQDFLHK